MSGKGANDLSEHLSVKVLADSSRSSEMLSVRFYSSGYIVGVSAALLPLLESFFSHPKTAYL